MITSKPRIGYQGNVELVSGYDSAQSVAEYVGASLLANFTGLAPRVTSVCQLALTHVSLSLCPYFIRF